MNHPVTPGGEILANNRPEYLVCAKCGNRLKWAYEYFYLEGPEFPDNEVIGKCGQCRQTFNRELGKEWKKGYD